jgi:hypothetical protein
MSTVNKKRKFVADGVFYAELNDFLTTTLGMYYTPLLYMTVENTLFATMTTAISAGASPDFSSTSS